MCAACVFLLTAFWPFLGDPCLHGLLHVPVAVAVAVLVKVKSYRLLPNSRISTPLLLAMLALEEQLIAQEQTL